MIKISINKEAISNLETETFPGNIHVVDNVADAKQAVSFLKKFKVVGFDTETRPSFCKGVSHKVSLIQLSTDSDCFLFRIHKMGLCDSLKEFLEDKDILKIGLSVRDDFGVLRKVSDAHPTGFLDLQKLVPNYNIADASLQKIYAILFDKRISKSQRLSNWEAKELTGAQQSYAAIDAWACLKIYNYIQDGKFKPNESKYIVTENEEEI